MNCAVAPVLEANVPKETTTYAAEGTDAARLAELRWLGMLGREVDHAELDALTAQYPEALLYTDYWVEAVTQGRPPLSQWVFVQPECYVEFPIPGGRTLGGTADFAGVYEQDDKLIVLVSDLKYGVGVPVSAYRNPQIMLYAWGVVSLFSTFLDFADDDIVTLQIAQVRVEDGISDWELTVGELREWITDEVNPAVEAVLRATPSDANPGKWCGFCAAAGVCRVRGERALETLNLDAALLSREEVSRLLGEVPNIRGFLKALEDRAMADALRDDPPPGWGLTRGAGQRKILDPETAIQRLAEAGYDPELATKPLGPQMQTFAVLDKLAGGKDRLAELLGEALGMTPGRLKLVPQDQADADSLQRIAEEFSEPYSEDD